MSQDRTTYLFLLFLATLAAFGCYLLIAPFLKPILFAMVAAILFHPMYSKIRSRVKSSTTASLLATFLVALLLAVSFFLLGRALTRALHDIYGALNANEEGRERLGAYLLRLSEHVAEIAARYIPVSIPDLRTVVNSQSQRIVAGIVNVTAGLLGSISSALLKTVICIFVLFFLFRDGKGMLRRAYVLLPLRPGQAKKLFTRIEKTLNAIVYGTLAIAVLQGILTGVGFWILGVSSPILWACITALCALIPVIGTGFILVPAICMLAFSGHWIKALILVAWGLVIVHPIDNVLRPYLIGDRTKLSTLFVFFSLLGGLQAFGTLGIFLGPVILAVTLAIFSFLHEESRRGRHEQVASWGL